MKHCLLALLLLSVHVIAQDLRSLSNPIKVDFTESRSLLSSEGFVPTVEEELRISNYPLYHALIIGVSDYAFSGPQLNDLDRPIEDARRLKDILTSRYLFPEENTHLLENPTREHLINAFDELTQKVKDKDNVLVFYAGHGYYDKATDFGYWLPSDAKPNSRANWIANSTIKDYMAAIPSKHTLLVTDACFAGSIFKTRAVNNLDTRKVYEMYKEKSRKAITSGNLTQVPDESYFLNFLLKILGENEQDFLPASALFSRLYEPVMNNSETIPQFAVVHGAGDEGGDFIFIRKK